MKKSKITTSRLTKKPYIYPKDVLNIDNSKSKTKKNII